jgi:hypothetical protein
MPPPIVNEVWVSPETEDTSLTSPDSLLTDTWLDTGRILGSVAWKDTLLGGDGFVGLVAPNLKKKN